MSRKRSVLALASVGAMMAFLVCSAAICGTMCRTTSRVEAEATGIAVANAVSAAEAQMRPTIEAACTETLGVASTASAMATEVAPTVEVVLAAVTPDPIFPPVGTHNPDLAMAYYETLVLGIAPQKSFVTDVGFPDFVKAEVDGGLAWTNESYKDLFVNGLGFVGLGFFPDSKGRLGDDINRASFGAFVFRVEEPFPVDPDAALRLIRETYPGLDVELVSLAGKPDTCDFESRAMLPLIVQRHPTLVPQLVHAGVTHEAERNRVVVWVVVARGAIVDIVDRLP